MRNKGKLLFSTSILICWFAIAIAAQSEQKKKSVVAIDVPQAIPVVTLLRAVQQSDFHRFLSALTWDSLKKYQSRKKDGPEIRDKWKRKLDDELGRYWFDNLRVSIGEESPKYTEVFITQKEERKTRFKVRKEAGQWKLIP